MIPDGSIITNHWHRDGPLNDSAVVALQQSLAWYLGWTQMGPLAAPACCTASPRQPSVRDIAAAANMTVTVTVTVKVPRDFRQANGGEIGRSPALHFDLSESTFQGVRLGLRPPAGGLPYSSLQARARRCARRWQIASGPGGDLQPAKEGRAVRVRCEAAPLGEAASWLHWKGKVSGWSIARFRLYPASRVSGRGPAGL
jgi:hypothetical protein